MYIVVDVVDEAGVHHLTTCRTSFISNPAKHAKPISIEQTFLIWRSIESPLIV
jgi:hypothetical protein